MKGYIKVMALETFVGDQKKFRAGLDVASHHSGADKVVMK